MASLLNRGGVRLGNIIQFEDRTETGYCRETVVADEAAEKEYKIGQILSKVTATGKYQIIDPAGTGGAELFAGIFIGTDNALDPDNLAVAANTDTNVVVLYRGQAAVGKKFLVFPAGTTDVQKAAVYASMEAAGIQLIDQL